MSIAVWIVSGLLAALYLFAGGSKTFTPAAKIPQQFPFVETTGLRVLRIIGGLEILGAIGLILPRLTGIAPVISGVAAAGLALLQVGAIIVHIRRGESKGLPMNVLLLALAVFVGVTTFLGF